MTNQKFYTTTTTPYVNAEPHIGFALEIVAADVIARYHRLLGEEVTFNTGTDEHGQKIYQEAQKANQRPQEYADSLAPKFKALGPLLNLSFDRFIRTTEPHHKQAAQHFWKLCSQNGDIHKQLYPVKYCVGCELEKTDSELDDGKCPLHPNRELDIRKEENYFFRFSSYQQPLLDFYKKNPRFVEPPEKMNEIVRFVEQGLQDFSISRLKKKMPWGVEVPDDPDHVMYVWFDALVNYISTIGWPDDEATFTKYWPGTQIAGKDNLRQQSAMWQAMLMSAGLPNSQKILINGFISINGQKMSKSLGNVITPGDMVDRYGIDGARYLLVHLGPVGGDMDVAWDKFDQFYQADLANGLGNLVSRIATLCHKSGLSIKLDNHTTLRPEVKNPLDNYRFDLALSAIWKRISQVDQLIEKEKPWQQKGNQLQATLQTLVAHLRQIAFELTPFLPETSPKITSHFKGPKITKIRPLFPRLQ